VLPDGTLTVLDFGCVKKLEEDFYRQYFQLFDLNRVLNDADFIAMLEELGMILPTDSKQDRKLLLGVCRDSIEALSRPFQYESFNFDDPSYVREIYE
tara:strand:+ start:393 stop:683 length:291 start_codon:yes stop_codon:yes gene_type:complete